MPAFSRAKLPRQQKTALADVFGLGFSWLTVSRSFSICIVSVLHLLVPIENNRKNFTPSLKTYELFDSTSNMTTLMFLTSAKVNAAITCACIMILKPLIQRFFRSAILHPKPLHPRPQSPLDDPYYTAPTAETSTVGEDPGTHSLSHTTTAPLKPHHNEPDVEDESRWNGRLVERGRIRQL
ncbi:hypothetical protein NEUTE1DRAFT_114001 [Neurospora tetrasperma FGSC 2508]|uniref:Rhodopsin domain-containing protein n=1 Tax=Neurospora tetrasperma (strain FGSC 2508 / ATCC MYA-4615 / P0657) TaxID=510951 RepID=F8MYY1_NEUT8|nr:uncharacterized protein NEUTE1DRAFT_114001 [Neurospora tetrasperma FGSC 2508]EGO51979.1 hypothetical protein NEUTE1DRAFT_114001 [Neurospora tetrasperma FGSC 2508]